MLPYIRGHKNGDWNWSYEVGNYHRCFSVAYQEFRSLIVSDRAALLHSVMFIEGLTSILSIVPNTLLFLHLATNNTLHEHEVAAKKVCSSESASGKQLQHRRGCDMYCD